MNNLVTALTHIMEILDFPIIKYALLTRALFARPRTARVIYGCGSALRTYISFSNPPQRRLIVSALLAWSERRVLLDDK
jgi:hypothetical protein